MNADQIRQRTKVLVDGATSTHKAELAAIELLGEIAAQIDELRDALAGRPHTNIHTNPEDCPSVRCGLWKECQGHP